VTAGLQEILDLEQIEVQVFRGRSRQTDAPRIFGGEVAAQALVAAGRTVSADRPVHSLHAYFLRPGEPVFHLSASLHVAEDGVTHQLPRPDTLQREELPTAEESFRSADERSRTWFTRISEAFPLELRFPEELPRFATARGSGAIRVSGCGWARPSRSATTRCSTSARRRTPPTSSCSPRRCRRTEW
jgi:acyl-CoA thioesterase